MKKLLTLILLTFALTGAGPMATAWEREAFKALKGIKDMATEQAKQEKAEKEKAAREQAAKEQAERDEQERAAREKAEQERAAKEQAERERAERAKLEAERAKLAAERQKWEEERRQWERDRQQAERADTPPQADPNKAEREKAEQIAKERAKWESGDEPAAQEQAEQAPAKPEKELNAYQKRMAALAEQKRQWEIERERERAEQERQREIQRCNEKKPLADDFSIVEYAQGKGVLTPDEVKKGREGIKACGFEIRTPDGDPNCQHYLFALGVQEEKTQQDRYKALEAEGQYEQMKQAKGYGLLTPSQEMEMDGMKKDLWEKKKAKNASQRKFEIIYREADEAGCLDKQS